MANKTKIYKVKFNVKKLKEKVDELFPGKPKVEELKNKEPGQIFPTVEHKTEKDPLDFETLFKKYSVKIEDVKDLNFAVELLGFKLYLSNQLLADGAVVYNKIKEILKNEKND